MADKDTVTKEFMSDAAHFADAFNFYMFGGEKKIAPDQLCPFQTSDTALPHSTDNAAIPIQRYRDVMKELTMMADDPRHMRCSVSKISQMCIMQCLSEI